MRLAVGATAALLAIQPLSGSELAAQTSTPLGGCSGFGTGTRTIAGAALGAWVGFVVAKMKLSDWNENSHTPAAIRQRNQITIGAAIAGGLIGNLAFRNACQATRPQGVVTRRVRQSAVHRPITQEEIVHSGVSGSVYDLVYALRRNWLNDRGLQSMSEMAHVEQDSSGNSITVPGETALMVYLDDMRLGTISELRELPVSGVTGVVYYDPTEAMLKWGTGHAHGAIQVLMVSGATGKTQSPFVASPEPSTIRR